MRCHLINQFFYFLLITSHLFLQFHVLFQYFLDIFWSILISPALFSFDFIFGHGSSLFSFVFFAKIAILSKLRVGFEVWDVVIDLENERVIIAISMTVFWYMLSYWYFFIWCVALSLCCFLPLFLRFWLISLALHQILLWLLSDVKWSHWTSHCHCFLLILQSWINGISLHFFIFSFSGYGLLLKWQFSWYWLYSFVMNRYFNWMILMYFRSTFRMMSLFDLLFIHLIFLLNFFLRW